MKLIRYFILFTICLCISTGLYAFSPLNYSSDYYTNTGTEDYGGNEPNKSTLATITDMIGDNDGYGYGSDIVADGDDLPFTARPDGSDFGWLFDNRNAAEMAATNGAQATDISTAFDVTFHHAFDMSQFDHLTSAIFTIDISGIQPDNIWSDGGGFTRLYLDGIEVTKFLDIPNQGAWGSGVFNFDVDLALLADGELDVYLDVFENYDGEIRSADEIAVDFTMLTVNGTTDVIPEPATLVLLGLGLAGYRLRRKFIR